MLRPGKVALGYAFVGFLWILTSDYLLFLAMPEVEDSWLPQSSKGIAFITVTAVVIYWLLLRENRRYQATRNLHDVIREQLESLTAQGRDAVGNLDIASGEMIFSSHCAALMGQPSLRRRMSWEEWLAPMSPSDQRRLRQYLRCWRAGERVPEGMEWQMLRADGSTGCYHAALKKIVDIEGRTTHVVMAFQNITERRQWENDLRQMRQKLKGRVRQPVSARNMRKRSSAA